MSKSLTTKVTHDLEETFDDVARILRRAADGLSDDAEEAIAQATQALRQAAQTVADKTPPEVRDVAKKAMDEAKAHPIASAAAVLSAALALITLVGLGRKKPA
jgi:ElaB/YqjD/DUF883 family membrane-anchored ribosome-binding protein